MNAARARTRGSLKDRAYVLRMDHDLSIRTISERLGVPRSTVGGWLRGHGETREMRTCLACQDDFTFISSKQVYCSPRCRWRRKTSALGGQRRCKLCEKSFTYNAAGKKFCGRRCKKKWWRVYGVAT